MINECKNINMKHATVLFLLVASVCIWPACHKGGSGGGNPPNEPNLVVEIDPPNGTVQAPSIGPFNLKVTITSAMPQNGVKIDISAKKDDGSGSGAFFSTTVNTSTGINNFSLTNTPSNVQCLVEVKVTSLSTSSNQWSGSYRYSRK
jgi:hypothetical protein